MPVRLLTLLFALCVCTTSLADEKPTEKSSLRILFVGHDPEKPRVAFADQSNEKTLALYKERTEAFDKFLKQRFKSVRVVLGNDYKAEMSNDVDVTIFDCRPKALTEAKREVDEKTGEMDYQAPTYLPADFNRAALMISENSPLIGEPLGLKLDWL